MNRLVRSFVAVLCLFVAASVARADTTYSGRLAIAYMRLAGSAALDTKHVSVYIPSRSLSAQWTIVGDASPLWAYGPCILYQCPHQLGEYIVTHGMTLGEQTGWSIEQARQYFEGRWLSQRNGERLAHLLLGHDNGSPWVRLHNCIRQEAPRSVTPAEQQHAIVSVFDCQFTVVE